MNFFKLLKEKFSGAPKAAPPKKVVEAAAELPGWPCFRGIKWPKTRRIYKKRQQLWIRGGAITRFETPDSKRISYRAARLHRIAESQRQGVQISEERRAAYVARRSAKWKKLVVEKLPQMFAQAMEKQGLGFMVGTGKAAEGMTPFDMDGPDTIP